VTERLPQPDATRIRDTPIRKGDLKIIAAGTHVVRVHALGGSHPIGWDQFRSWGPTRSRFDHQSPPTKAHPSRRVAYVAYGRNAFTCSLAEFFQDDGGGILPFDLERNRPAMSVFEMASDVRLLNLSAGWVIRAGGNQAITSGRRTTSRAWARAIYRHHAEVEGLAYPSSVWGPGRCVVLWERAEHCLPTTALGSRSLDDPYLRRPIIKAAHDLNTFTLS
jgi:hypothetical protein